MTQFPGTTTVRSFRSGDGQAIADAWTKSAPQDGITPRRLRDLILLDRNFDADGLFIAEDDGAVVGAAYAVAPAALGASPIGLLLGILPVAAFIGAAIYLADVRPAVAPFKKRNGGRGGQRQGPYGPW